MISAFHMDTNISLRKVAFKMESEYLYLLVCEKVEKLNKNPKKFSYLKNLKLKVICCEGLV